MSDSNMYVAIEDFVAGLGSNDATKAFVSDINQVGSDLGGIYGTASTDLVALGRELSASLRTTGADADKILGDIKQLWNDASATGTVEPVLATISDNAGKLLSQALTDVGEKLINSGYTSAGNTVLGASATYQAYRTAGDTPGQALDATLNTIFHGAG
jgi:hypothetical protein